MEPIISIAEEVDEIVPSYSSGTSPNSSKHIDDPKEQEGNLCLNSHSKIISEVYSSDIDVMEQLQEINNKDVMEQLQGINNEDYQDIDVMEQLQEINNKDVVEQLQGINNEDYLDIDVMKQLQGINNEDNLDIDVMEQLQEINNKDVVEQLQRLNNEDYLDIDVMKLLQEINIKDFREQIHLSDIKQCSGSFNELDATPYLYMDQILDEMITTLTHPDTIMIGLYGSSYNSKDNVIKKITRRVERDGQFDVVIMASLVKKNTRWNKSLDVRNIQEELGNQLGLQFQEKTLEERASCLSDKIKMKQKILIILDDLQGEINLTKIGIPFGNDHMGCRILFAANNKKVLSNTMKIQSVFSMDDWF